MPKHRFAALDTHFLLALAAGEEECQSVIDWLSSINLYALVTPTVIQELMDIEDAGGDVASFAAAAKSGITTWGIIDPPLSATDHGIAEIMAKKLVEKGVLPDECINDGLVVAEAALQDCRILVTYRETLLEASFEHMKLVFLESDIGDVVVVSPAEITAYRNKSA